MFKRYIIAGVLIWVPIWATLLVLKFLIDMFDKSLALLPKAYQPINLLGFHIPGLGLLFAVIMVFITGMLMTNFIGHRLVALWEKILARIPLVRSIYHAVKQVLHSVLTSSEESFRNVMLVEYPRKGLWSVAFQTSSGFEWKDAPIEDEMVTVFLPTTPNPTSGYLLLVPRKDTIPLDISVDQALKMVISLGVVLPENGKEKGEVNA